MGICLAGTKTGRVTYAEAEWTAQAEPDVSAALSTDGRTLLHSILSAAHGTTAILGVPSVSSAATSLLESCGFQRMASCLRMSYGERSAAGRPENVFAIADGAMG